MKKRRKIIFVGLILVVLLSFTACTQYKKEKNVVHKEVEASPEPELSDTRKELERLYEERGTKNHQTDTQIFLLTINYKFPLFEDVLRGYSFEERMDEYLVRLKKLAVKKGEYDFLYNAVSDSLIWGYHFYQGEMSEEDCKRFLEIINLCKKRLKTAMVWEETEEEPQESPTTMIKLTDTRKKLERICDERGHYNPRSTKEIKFLMDKYNIPDFYEDSSENAFEKCFNRYLDKMEKLAKKRGEYDLLYEELADNLIWDYDYYRTKLTEKQCQRMLKLIKLCKKRKKTAKTLYK